MGLTNMSTLNTVLLEHMVTEKATEASSHSNQYTFKVAGDANRVSIKSAVERQFGVEVMGIRVLNVKPKAKRDRVRRGNIGYKSAYKKAMVRLKVGFSIELT